jgi:hypothetical protein
MPPPLPVVSEAGPGHKDAPNAGEPAGVKVEGAVERLIAADGSVAAARTPESLPAPPPPAKIKFTPPTDTLLLFPTSESFPKGTTPRPPPPTVTV